MTTALPLNDVQKLFHAMAARSAFDYFRASPPQPPLAIGEHDEFAYLPRSEAQAQTFQPHGWVYAAMQKAYDEGVEQGKNIESRETAKAEQIAQERVNALMANIANLERVIEKYKLVDRIRDEVNSFSVNTDNVMDLVEDLARMVP